MFLDVDGKILFRFFNKQMRQDEVSYAERQQLYVFVEAQLAGKKIEAPASAVDAEVAVLKSSEIKWKEKSILWIMGRILALIFYALFWLSLTMALFLYLSARNLVPRFWATSLYLPMVVGPMLPHIVWLHFKKKKVLRELKLRELEK